MRRMALPTGINIPGWKVLYHKQLDQKSLDVKIGEISFEEAKTQEIQTGTMVLATHGTNLMVKILFMKQFSNAFRTLPVQ